MTIANSMNKPTTGGIAVYRLNPSIVIPAQAGTQGF
jgi:hypothetical protein